MQKPSFVLLERKRDMDKGQRREMGQKKLASWLLEIGATYVDKRSGEKASPLHAVNRIGAPSSEASRLLTFSFLARNNDLARERPGREIWPRNTFPFGAD